MMHDVRPLLFRLVLCCALLPTMLPAQAVPDSLLRVNAVVRVRVPTMGSSWHSGRIVRSTSAIDCLAILIDRERPEDRQRLVFLHGVDSLRVDRRTNAGVLTNIPPAEESDWQPFSRRELKVANAGCTGRRR